MPEASRPGDTPAEGTQEALFPIEAPDAARRISPLQVVGIALAVGVGAAVFWLQAGLALAFGQLASGGLGLQDNLTEAADALVAGDYARGEAAYRNARASTDRIERAVASPQVDFLSRFQGLATATGNLDRLSVAATDIAVATGELLTLYGDLSGKAGTTRIFSDGAIDLARLETLPGQVAVAKAQLIDAQFQLESIQANSRPARVLDGLRDTALAEVQPVLTAVEALDRISPFLHDALGANGVRR